jgi:hypothetical protein
MVKYAARRDRHGQAKTPLWRCWNAMLQRCYNRHCPTYRWYGARGILVCEDWRTFTAFRDWALASGYRAGLTIDREDGNGNYEPGNCRWVTKAENSRRSRNTRWFLTAFGETKTIGQWLQDRRCRRGLKEGAVRMRVRRGWDVEDALTKPTGPYKYKER